MEAVVVDVGSKLLKAGFAIPDQTPAMVEFLATRLLDPQKKKECLWLSATRGRWAIRHSLIKSLHKPAVVSAGRSSPCVVLCYPFFMNFE
ncbi:hypothetical protein L195_g022562 [Trifolium pratense]|uniref:Actin-related protein 7-like n=1 Tax=Trifolium pratense TaxID=57577 RepID=A0A2K3N8C6_TRIPR|nr:hypothetical protein L195_g022562 [Trifolium pratense]